MAKKEAQRSEEPAPDQAEPPVEGGSAPWWTRSAVQDPAGDPAGSGNPAVGRQAGTRTRGNVKPAPRAPLMGVPVDDPAPAQVEGRAVPEAPAARLRSAPAAAPSRAQQASAPAPVAMAAGGELGEALQAERIRLQAQRAALELQREDVETQIAAVEARVGHVDALLAGEIAAGPPVELPSIGASRADGAAAA